MNSDATCGEDPTVRVRDIENLDRPIYRIFPLWFFEAALRVNGGCLTLVRPSTWEDPQEDLSASIIMRGPSGDQKPLEGYLQPAYAQSWSFEGESDALLRAYSRVTRDGITSRNIEPRNEGVQVRTTPRRLIHALNGFIAKRRKQDTHFSPDFQFYLVGVRYVPDVMQSIVEMLSQIGPTKLGRGEHRVSSLALKRQAFRHESEARIVLLTPEGTAPPMFTVDVDPNQTFEEVRFDPRLAAFEIREREEMARRLGYNGSIGSSNAYATYFLECPMSRHWDDYPS